MKKYLAIFLLLLAGGALSPRVQAQEPVDPVNFDMYRHRALRLVHDFGVQYSVHPSPRLDLILIQNFNGEQWRIEEQRIFARDIGRREVWNYAWNGQALVNADKIVYMDGGSVAYPFTIEKWRQNRFEEAGRYVYDMIYNGEGEGRVLSATYQEHDGTAWTNRERRSYTMMLVNGRNYVNGGQKEFWNDGSWEADERYHVDYDESIITISYEARNGDEWEWTERVIFDEGWNIPPAIWHQNVTWLSVFLSDFSDLHSPVSRLSDHTVQVWQDGAWVDEHRLRSTMFHWMTGEPVVRLHERYVDGAWEPAVRLETSFQGSPSFMAPTKITTAVPEGDDWRPTFYESYLYDTDIRLIKAERYIADAEGELQPTRWYTYRWAGSSVGVDDDEAPAAFRLDPAYPNPFNPSTRLVYHLNDAGPASIRVYDALGRQVAVLLDGVQPAGRHEVAFDAPDLPSGTYFVRMDAAGGAHQIQKVTLLR